MSHAAYVVTLTAESREELQRKIKDLHAEWNDAPSADTPQTSTAPDKNKGKGKAKSADKAPDKPDNPKVGTEDDQPNLPLEETAAEPDPHPAQEDTPTQEDTPAPVSVDQLREQLMTYAEDHGSTQAKALVAEWGKVSAVPEEERNAVYLAAGGSL